jgi:small ligand-binding sensory domain FIST
MSRRFRSACAEGADWGQAVDACLAQIAPADDATFGLVYATEAMAPHLAEIVGRLRKATGIDAWTGCVGAGVCGTGREIHAGYGLSLMVGTLPEDAAAPLGSLRQPEDVADVAPEDWDVAARPIVALVHGDPRNAAVPDILSLLPETLDGYLIGGLSVAPGGPTQVVDGDLTGGGVSGLLLSTAVPVAVGLTQGCRPLGPARMVTGTDGDWVTTLDGALALQALKDDLGPEGASNLKSLGGMVHGAIPVEGSDTGDYLVRNLMAVDPSDGRLGLAADLEDGDRLMFVRRDAAAAEEDLRAMVRRLLGRLGARAAHPRGALYVSCLARPSMFSPPGELAILRDELGAVPLTGFFANGEVNNNRLYTYTGVLTLFL